MYYIYNVWVHKLFLSFILSGAIVCAPVHAVSINNNCDNNEFRKNNPDICPDFGKKTFSWATAGITTGAALATIGAGIALFSGGDSGGSNAPTPTTATVATYNTVGADVRPNQILSITTTEDYTKNFNQYNDIRLAYSLARGYTGKKSTIAVLDSGAWHGNTVTSIATGPIAPDAVVTQYKITDEKLNFLPYEKIGTIIDGTSANIYNASWEITNRYATQAKTRKQFEAYTHKNFTDALTRAAVERDAIFVWAAGNSGAIESNALSAAPIAIPELNGHFINVVAWDSQTGALAEFSNACGITKNYCITAPGTDIRAGKYATVDGTSFAAPIVSAAVATIREAFPYMKSTQITELLFTTARDLGEIGIDSIYGHGMLDLERATRPVGTELVAISDTMTQPLQTARIAAPVGNKIKSANLTFAYFDSFGRAFTKPLNDNIRTKNPGRAFDRLNKFNHQSVQIGKTEIGFRNTNMFESDGFMQSNSQTTIGFVATNNTFNIGDIEFFYRSEFGIASPTPSPDSVIRSYSNVYTTSIEMGTKINDWRFAVATNDAIIDGRINLHLASGRANDGRILFRDYNIDLASRPALEYTASYKNTTFGFIDNPHGTDEIYVIASGRISF